MITLRDFVHLVQCPLGTPIDCLEGLELLLQVVRLDLILEAFQSYFQPNLMTEDNIAMKELRGSQ